MTARVLVVDDHEEVVAWLRDELADEGYVVEGMTDPVGALQRAIDAEFDVVVADVEMPGLRGPEFLKALHRARPGQVVILVTAFGSVDLAVRTVRDGAADFLTKPFTIEVLVLAIERALRVQRQSGPTRPPPVPSRHGVVAQSDAMRRVLDRAARAARTHSSVLLCGETGSGKGTVARFIHANSSRRDAPFVHVNCAAIPTNLVEGELFGVRRGAFTDAREDREGLFQRAHGGTLFLDEVGDLPLEAQPKLLHALESGRIRALGASVERSVDVRLIAATNRDLRDAIAEKRFRDDLYFRLNVIRLDVPPLRERTEDVLPLVEQLLVTLSARMGRRVAGVSTDAAAWLQRQPWPGNVRELANVIERAIALGDADVLTLADLDGDTVPTEPPFENLGEAVRTGAPLDEVERDYMRRVLASCGGNVSAAARRLGVDRRTLYRRLGSDPR